MAPNAPPVRPSVQLQKRWTSFNLTWQCTERFHAFHICSQSDKNIETLCIKVYMSVYMPTCVSAWLHEWLHGYTSVYMPTRVSTNLHGCLHAYPSVYTPTQVSASLHECLHDYTSVYMPTWVSAGTSNQSPSVCRWQHVPIKNCREIWNIFSVNTDRAASLMYTHNNTYIHQNCFSLIAKLDAHTHSPSHPNTWLPSYYKSLHCRHSRYPSS